MIHTIKGRVIIVFILCIIFVGVLTAVYSWEVLTLKKRLVAIEAFHDLFDNILELRRYEKNFMYFRESSSLKEIVDYLDKTQEGITRLSQTIITVAGQDEFQQFEENLLRYKNLIEASINKGDKIDIAGIRYLGCSMVNFAKKLLKRKRKRIQDTLKRILYIPIAYTGGFVILIILIFQSQARNVLNRLAFIQKATEEVAKGNFTPISDPKEQKDEISSLIIAFNKMIAELESRQEQLVESRKLASIGTLTAGIAHELNNPLNNISLTADSLLEEYQSLSEGEFKEMILDIINQTSRASEVVRNLLDFSRSDIPSFKRLEVKEVIEATVKLIKNQLMLMGMKLVCKSPDHLPPIRGDLHNLEQVFLNLFLNAIQAMPDGGVITVEANDSKQGYVEVKVSDTGVGIKPEDLEKIFDPFYTTKPVGRGSGLGLSIVYGIVKKHGGYVEVKSELNVGTTFIIYLPIFDEQRDAEDEHATGNH